MEAAAVNVEVYIALLEIWGNCLPYSDFRVHILNFLPCRLTNALAVERGGYEQQLQVSEVVFGLYDNSAYRLAVVDYAVSGSLVYGALNSITGDYLAVLLEMVVTLSEFFRSTEAECFLIVLYELLPV